MIFLCHLQIAQVIAALANGSHAPWRLQNACTQYYLDTYIELHVPDSYVGIIIIYSLLFLYSQFLEEFKEQNKFLQLL